MKKINNILLITIILSLVLPIMVYAAPPDKPNGSQGGPGGQSSSSNISYKGASTITSSVEENDKNYTSTVGGENALLVSGGSSTINNITITKSGDESSEASDFYGTNASLFVYNNASLTVNHGTITTNGSHANAVFAYSTGKIILNNLDITTTSNNSGGVMVTGGGTLNANNCNVRTSGNSSAAIRSDRVGGTLTVENGTYETSGVGSPAIYSTADITVKNATLQSYSSEGVVVEGKNSVTLENVNLVDTNNTLNGNSETYKNIFLYQSMSGDADVGTSSFTAKNSNIETNQGDTIFVTNTTATINLENNTFTNTDGDFLRIQTGKWGTSGSNGGIVTMNLVNQKVTGNLIIDSISTLDLNLSDKSVLIGSIDNDNQAKNVKLTLSSDSVLSLNGDTYLDTLVNDQSDNKNIYSNGYKLYVNNEEISINEDNYNENNTTTDTNNSNVISNNNNLNKYIIPIAILVAGILLFITTNIVIKKIKK